MVNSERLDPRKEKILASIVDIYTETGRPVGSATVAHATGLGVSAATVRNEMRVLEEHGLIEQPHTSAGRIPTERGFRYYVDYLMREERLPRSWRVALSRLFADRAGEVEVLLSRASRFVSEATRQAAVIVGPYPEDETLGDFHISILSDDLLLVSLITSAGRAVLKGVRLREPVAAPTVATVEQISSTLRGTPISEVGKALRKLSEPPVEGRRAPRDVDTLLTAISRQFDDAGTHSVPYFVGGASWVARGWPREGREGFEDVLKALEDQQPVISAMKALSDMGDVGAFIGSENPVDSLRSCSIVAGSIVADSRVVGSVGVVGPTRMNYAQVVPLVREISHRLGRVMVPVH